METTVSPFAAWETFYVIVGSSGAALTGLQFVVITLGAESARPGRQPEVKAFGTPTVVHFCAVLLISAILSMPWPAMSSAGLALSSCGVAGLVYAVIVIRRVRWSMGYRPVLEDWIWHVALPILGYGALLAGGLGLERNPPLCLFAIAAIVVLLLFVGIHNAWDAITYMAIERAAQPKDPP